MPLSAFLLEGFLNHFTVVSYQQLDKVSTKKIDFEHFLDEWKYLRKDFSSSKY
jgi:hypothetical protein